MTCWTKLGGYFSDVLHSRSAGWQWVLLELGEMSRTGWIWGCSRLRNQWWRRLGPGRGPAWLDPEIYVGPEDKIAGAHLRNHIAKLRAFPRRRGQTWSSSEETSCSCYRTIGCVSSCSYATTLTVMLPLRVNFLFTLNIWICGIYHAYRELGCQ